MGGRGGSSGIAPKGGNANFPQLQGSEKQVKWAEQIRKDAMDVIDRQIKWYKEELPKRPYDKDYMQASFESYQEIKKAVIDTFSGTKEASKIIDSRNKFSPARIYDIAKKSAEEKVRKKKRD